MNDRVRPRIGVAVIGSGYVGTVVGACLASVGHSVVAVEVDSSKLALLRNGRAPFHEYGLDPLIADGLANGRLCFTGDVHEALASSDIVFLCVETPAGVGGHPDMGAVELAARAIAAATDGHHVLVTKSTVPIGTGRWLACVMEDAGRALPVVSNPEFLKEGSAVDDFLHPDRVVLGSDDPVALDLAEAVYQPILDQAYETNGRRTRRPLVRTSLATAEMIKYAANGFLATKVSFINEVAQICELVGADVSAVSSAIGLDRRIGRDFLDAGIGWGGSCFGKDLAALVATSEDLGYEPRILRATISVNDRQRDSLVERLQHRLHGLRGRRIALLGLAFKPGTDDVRDSPALEVARRLLGSNAFVSAYDPLVGNVNVPGVVTAVDPYEAVERADAVALITEWPEFLNLDFSEIKRRMRGDLFVDARNMFDHASVSAHGLRYEGIGRPVAEAVNGALVL
jgi:nucleotide sugar dehydrogenase